MSSCFFYLDVPFCLSETVHNWSIHWSIDGAFGSDCLRVLPNETLASSCHLETVFWHFLCVALVEKSYISLTLWTLVYLSPQLGASYSTRSKLLKCVPRDWALERETSLGRYGSLGSWQHVYWAKWPLIYGRTDSCIVYVRWELDNRAKLVKSAVPHWCSFPIQIAQFMLYTIKHPGFP